MEKIPSLLIVLSLSACGTPATVPDQGESSAETADRAMNAASAAADASATLNDALAALNAMGHSSEASDPRLADIASQFLIVASQMQVVQADDDAAYVQARIATMSAIHASEAIDRFADGSGTFAAVQAAAMKARIDFEKFERCKRLTNC